MILARILKMFCSNEHEPGVPIQNAEEKHVRLILKRTKQ